MLPTALTTPYYAAIFTSRLARDNEGYEEMALKLPELAAQ